MGEPWITESQSPRSSVNEDDDNDEINIFLKVRSTMGFKVMKTQTIRNLKEMFCSKEGVSESLQKVFFAGECLQDRQTLADCGIERNSTVDLILNTMSAFARKVFIKIPSNQCNLVILAKLHDTILQIKSIIQAKQGLDSDDFYLMHDGKFLQSHQTLASLNIGNDSTFYLIHHPRDVLTISVSTPTQRNITLEVKQSQMIGELKALIGSMTDTQVENASLLHARKALEDSRTIASYLFKENSLLELSYPFQIFVRLWNGKTITLDVLPSDNSVDINAKVLKKLGLPVTYNPVFLNGKKLHEDRALVSYCIQKDTTLEMGTPKEKA